MIHIEQCRTMIKKAVGFLPEKEANEVLLVLYELLGLVYIDLRTAIIGNPVEHHFIVLGHMMVIAKEEGSNPCKESSSPFALA